MNPIPLPDRDPDTDDRPTDVEPEPSTRQPVPDLPDDEAESLGDFA